jgi:hypothetical protein
VLCKIQSYAFELSTGTEKGRRGKALSSVRVVGFSEGSELGGVTDSSRTQLFWCWKLHPLRLRLFLTSNSYGDTRVISWTIGEKFGDAIRFVSSKVYTAAYGKCAKLGAARSPRKPKLKAILENGGRLH